MFASEIPTFRPVSLDSTPRREVGVNKMLLITLLVVGTLALIPVAAAACGVDAEAYRLCAEKCTELGFDRAYDACVGHCAQQFLNPYC